MLEFPYRLQTVEGHLFGLIVLQADETIEWDMRRLMPDTARVLVSRVPSGTHVTPESLVAMETELQRAACLFPAGVSLSAIGYGCTSGTAQIGANRVAQAIKSVTDTPHVTEPVSAVIAACGELGVSRVGLLSPYIESVSDRLCETLSAAGITVAAFGSFNQDEERTVARISPSSIHAAAVGLAKQEDMDALFISCTNLRTLDVIDRIAADTGIPVLTSNQVLAWNMLRLVEDETAHRLTGRPYA